MIEYKLSIIIPVYNVENYLEECMESILSQPHDECEIIIVDDGSTDNSGLLCDQYKNTYIKVVHKENGGLSSARNAGLEVATGRYIAFLDSDDRLSTGAIQSILSWIEGTDVDICFMEAIVFYPDGRTNSLGDCIEQKQIRGKTKQEVFEHLSTRPKYPGSACTKIYKRSFLMENDLYFPRDRRLSEDLGYVLDCLLAAKNYDCLNIPYYEYRQNREGSIRSKVDINTFNGMKSFVEETVEKVCNDHQPKNLICECALSFAAYEYSIMLWQYSHLRCEDRHHAKEFLDNYKWIMKFGKTKKCRLVRCACILLGIRTSATVLNIYMNNR